MQYNLYVAKCNLGKVNLEAMPSSNLWMQEALVQPWRFAGAFCDAYTQYAATAGRIKLGVAPGPVQGCFMTFTRSALLAIIRKLISLAHSLASLAIFAPVPVFRLFRSLFCFYALWIVIRAPLVSPTTAFRPASSSLRVLFCRLRPLHPLCHLLLRAWPRQPRRRPQLSRSIRPS